MSDPAVEPGAPAPGATNIPPASEKSVAKEISRKAPSKVVALASLPDRTLLRINKLIATPGGLSAALSTFNYTLYLLAYLEAKSIPLQARLYQLLGREAIPVAALTTPSRIAALGSHLSSTRTTLRLLGLFPIYAWMRQLLQGPKPGQDRVLWATALTQCTLYGIFQFLENVAMLTDNKILAPSVTARWTPDGKTARLYFWSYRAWLGGVLCDFVRLGREAQLESVKRAKRSDAEATSVDTRKADERADAKWWSESIIPVAWLPIALQASLESGLPGFNLGIMGICGLLAGLSRTSALWAATA